MRLLNSHGLQPLKGTDATTQLFESYANPISPENDYFLFFDLWLYALRLDSELQAVIQSNSWLLTLPLREARRWAFTPLKQTKRYVRLSLRIAKRVYQALPLSYQTKTAHRRTLAKLLPGLLRLSAAHSAAPTALLIQEIKKSYVDLASIIIDLPVSTNPLVLVVIPVYGKIEYTMRCLVSIGEHPPNIPFEVIVVDDCSLDNSVELLTQVGGIHLIRNVEN